MRILTQFITPVALLLSLCGIAIVDTGWVASTSEAVQLADGTVYFNHPPRLISATTTRNSAYAWNAKYYFTLNVPENAGEPLQQVAIAQYQGFDDVRFNLEKTQAFEGTYRDKVSPFTIATVTRIEDAGPIQIAFDPPVPAGKTVTIALHAIRNPTDGGIYQFGVTAFPAGEKSYGQFLGFARLHFYRNGDGLW